MWILVVEDEPAMGDLLRRGLQEQNHRVTLVSDGLEALSATRVSAFDAVVLDVMLPGLDGITLARRIRDSGSKVPILMLTALDAPADIVRGLDAGADDYLVKPFALNMLTARLRALSRRAAQPPVARLQLDDLELDPAAHEVRRGGKLIPITPTEFRMLEYLMRRAGRAASRSSIIEAVWGFEEDVELNTVDTYIKLLRDKIDHGRLRKLIHTVRGYGYIVREPA